MIVVTGAAGFIGSRILEALSLVHPAAKLLAVDHPVPSEKAANLRLAPGVGFLTHTAFLNALEAGTVHPSLILHMGACSSTTMTDWEYLRSNNLEYSQRLWNWSAANGCRLIYASSAATYGMGECGFDDTSDLHSLQPLNLYGKSKHDFDLWIQERLRDGSRIPPQWVGLKFFNVFGCGESHKGRMASMVFHGFHQIRRQGFVRLFESHRPDYEHGGQLRDFIYIKDVLRVILELGFKPGISGLFNLGTGVASSFRELIEAVFHAQGMDPRIEYIPMPEDLRGKYQYYTKAEMGKLAAAGVGFTPVPLAIAVADYVRWLKEQPE